MREFNYITREAQAKIEKRTERYDISSEEKRAYTDKEVKASVALNVKELVECTNSSGYQQQIVEGIVEGLVGSHRHLQGEFMIALAKAMQEYGKVATDPRNQYGVEMAQQMGKAL